MDTERQCEVEFAQSRKRKSFVRVRVSLPRIVRLFKEIQDSSRCPEIHPEILGSAA